MSFGDRTGTAFRDLIERAGFKGAVDLVREGLKDKQLKAEDFSYPVPGMRARASR